MTNRPTDENGFALTEVLVGFAILALVSLGMMRAFGGTMNTLRIVSASEAHLALSERLLAERRAESWPQTGRREGIEDGLFWQTSVEPLLEQPTADGGRLFRLVIRVGRPGDVAPSQVLTTLVLGEAER